MKKNTKQNKQKKTTKPLFRLENLEPRVLMSGSVYLCGQE
jgi:hypothetical protein